MSYVMTQRQKILDRIQSLMARTESSFEEEARTCAVQAIRLMKEHGVSVEDLAKNQLRVLLRHNGRKGGEARARNLSKKQLSEIAQLGVEARQAKLSPKKRKQIAKKAARARWQLEGKGK